MHRYFPFLAGLSVTFGIFGALPPFAQSAKEISTLVMDSHLQELMGSAEVIREIMKTDSGYAVMTSTRFLKVDIEYQSAGRPGPVPFVFHFGEPLDLQAK